MKLSTERKPGSIVELSITAEEQEFQSAVNDAIKRQTQNVQIPGFRKGKAPRHMVERFYGGREVFAQDAAEKLMDKLYQEALQQEDLRPVGDPELSSMDLEPTLTFVVAVPVYPTIDLGDYAAVRVDPVDAAVSDNDVEDVILRLRQQQGSWIDAAGRKPAEGDQVTIDYTVFEGEDEFQAPVTDAVWVLGETNLLQQLRDRIEDLEVGGEDEFEVFFEEDDETADPTIRGKQLKYTVKLKDLKERELPEADDAFAKSVNDNETMQELREAVRRDIHQGKTGDARTEVLNTIIDRVGESTTIDIPAVMIDEEVEHQLGHRKEDMQKQGISWEQFLTLSGKTEDALKEELRPDAERRLRNTMILQEIGRQEAIQVTDDDIQAEINDLVGPDLNPDEADADAVERAKRMRDVYSSDYFRNVLQNDLFERRLTDRIIELATEGKGAVLNGWTVPTDEDAASAPTQAEIESVVEEAMASDDVTAVSSSATGETAADDEKPSGKKSTSDAQSEKAKDEKSPSPKTVEDDEKPAAKKSTSDDNAEKAKGEKSHSSKMPKDGEGTDWVAGDGTDNVPDGFPIKGNASSKIYHPEESPNYSSTIAEIYFANGDAAEAHGYRLPKTLQAGQAAGSAAADAVKNATDDKK